MNFLKLIYAGVEGIANTCMLFFLQYSLLSYPHKSPKKVVYCPNNALPHSEIIFP